MDNQGKGIPLLKEVFSLYKGIYPRETIKIVYRFLRERINSLTPVVKVNEKAPLMTIAERGDFEREDHRQEIENRFRNNNATRKALADCEVAWQRLINGTIYLCTECGEKIDKDRRQAVPQSSKCKKCRERIGIRVS